MTTSTRVAIHAFSAALLLALAGLAHACTVPVFRYALERWEPDPYVIVVYHKGPADEQIKAFEKTVREAGDADPAYTNIAIETFDVDGELEGWPKQLWEMQEDKTLPRALLKFPFRSGISVDLWAGKPDSSAVKKLIDSPLRREVARRLLKGDSAVWVLLESGDQKADAAAEKRIQSELKRLEKEIELPEVAEEDRKYLSGDGPELKVKFSLVRMSRDDPQEALFREMLLLSESDLKSDKFKNQPMAFPVFGRGRVLWGIVGDGINKDTLEESCFFLTGACSCQVKELNPGMDLLMAAGWENMVHGQYVVDEALPPLMGLPTTAALAVPTKTATTTATETAAGSEASANPLMTLGLVLCIGVGLLAVATVALRSKQAEQ